MDALAQSFVLTRLHARYTKETLGADLVFRAARPIIGGREIRNNNGQLERGGIESPSNNFQARYIIRHPWTGPDRMREPTARHLGWPAGRP